MQMMLHRVVRLHHAHGALLDARSKSDCGHGCLLRRPRSACLLPPDALFARHARKPFACAAASGAAIPEGNGRPHGEDSTIQSFANVRLPSQPPPSVNSGGLSELMSLISCIPFRRIAIWAAVGAVAYTLSDFFGVRPCWQCICMHRCHLHERFAAECCTCL